MFSEAIINLSVVGITCFVLVVYLLKFVLKYKHEYESNPLCTATVLFCLSTVVVATFVLPADIFLVSFAKNQDGTFKEWATNETLAQIDKAVFASYYSLYGASALLIFIVIPFMHFLNEESESNPRDRMHHAIKYTFCFMLIMFLLLGLGAFLKINSSLDPNEIFNKIIHLTETTKFQNSLTMLLTVITTAGFLNVSFYTASGIFSWPISLILGTSSVGSRVQAMNDQEDLLRLRISTLQEKARVSRLSPREREQLTQAEQDLRELEREEAVLTNYSETITYRMRKMIRPIQILIGVIFGLLSVLLLATLIIVNVDRILHGAGPRQGYVLLEPTIFNPLNYIYTKFQDLTFIGPMPLLVVTCFLVVATISGIRNLGLWFMFARLHRVKVGRTQPQALLFFCMTMMLTALAFNLILYSMTTEFVTFGSQNFRTMVNGTAVVKPCSLADYKDNCLLTRGSILLMRMMSQVWIFGAIFYWWTWAFVGVATISLVAYIYRGRRSPTHGIVNDLDEFQD